MTGSFDIRLSKESANPHVNLTAERQRRSVPVMLRMPAAGYVRR
jgi:hypothetical protein